MVLKSFVLQKEILKCNKKQSESKFLTAMSKEHKQLRSIVEDGKGKLQWERSVTRIFVFCFRIVFANIWNDLVIWILIAMPRDIPAAALANLESLASTDFKANLGRIIHDIYQVIIIIVIKIKIIMIIYIFRRLTQCSLTCHRATTRSAPSTGDTFHS